MTVPFTYLIGWSHHRKFYYGVRYRHNCSPDELWVKYFTSSKAVKRLRIELGEPDIIQIRQVFRNAEVARAWEHKVLIRMKAVKRSDFINKHDMVSLNVWKGEKLSDQHRANIGNAIRGRKQNPEWIKKRTADVWVGRKHTEESRAKMSESHKGIRRVGWNQPDEVKHKISAWQKANSSAKGTRWWNDGCGNVRRSKECPGAGWLLGRSIISKTDS